MDSVAERLHSAEALFAQRERRSILCADCRGLSRRGGVCHGAPRTVAGRSTGVAACSRQCFSDRSARASKVRRPPGPLAITPDAPDPGLPYSGRDAAPESAYRHRHSVPVRAVVSFFEAPESLVQLRVLSLLRVRDHCPQLRSQPIAPDGLLLPVSPAAPPLRADCPHAVSAVPHACVERDPGDGAIRLALSGTPPYESKPR